MSSALDSVEVFFESVSAVTATPSVDVGTRRRVGGVEYLYIYNTSNTQISVGQLARIPATDLDAVYSCTATNAASQAGGEMGVGVVYHATLTTGTYGWVVTRGMTYIALDGSEVSMNSGDLIAPGVDGGFVVKNVTLSTGVPLGFAVNSIVTTVGTGKAVFRSPFFG